MHPFARGLELGILAALVVFLAAAVLLRRRHSWMLFAAWLLPIALVVWLGSYSLSPLGFSTGRIPLVSGFWITRSQRPQLWLRPQQVVNVAEGSAMGIQTVLLPGPVSCIWAASNGGSFEDPLSCDTAYMAGQNEAFDVLRVDVRSACGLPSAVAELHISVLP